MRDWIREARRKLAGSKLTREEREEVARELAGYLEDLCEDASVRGVEDSAVGQVRASQSAATGRAAAELHEDAKLGAHLYSARKENPMNLNERTQRLWLPGMSLLFASVVLLAIFQRAGIEPRFRTIWFSGDSITPGSVYSSENRR